MHQRDGDAAEVRRFPETTTSIIADSMSERGYMVTTMQELFVDELRDLYDAEKQLTKALPGMADASATDQLRNAFTEHLEQTMGHVQRLEEIFEALGEKRTGKKCAAMLGLIKEGNEVVNDSDETAVRDAGLIAAAQKVEHYEMSGYGSARTHAELLGNQQAASLLKKTLDEEKAADAKLNEIALTLVNAEAMSASANGATRHHRR
jgi:ferritin-like metal-binding protein YciE